jgi:HEAT repeat protein
MRRSVVLVVALVAAVAALAVWVVADPDNPLRPYFTGEPFYKNRAASAWGRALRADDPQSPDARRTLVAGGAQAVPVLTWLLQSKAGGAWGSAEWRWTAAEVLRDIGPDAAAAAPALVAALTDPDAHVRAVAAEALGAIHPKDPAVVAALTERLKTDDARHAARALASFGTEGQAAGPALIELLHHADPAERWSAAWALGRLRVGDAVGPLTAALKDEDAEVREHAAEALGDIGPASAPAVGALTAALKDPNFRVRRDAARSLSQIGPPAAPAVPALRELKRTDPEEPVRAAAAQSLKALGVE